MPAVEITPTGSEPLRRLVTEDGAGLTGATVRCDVRRSVDGLVLDFADSTFKAVGAVGTRYRVLAEVDAVNWRGLYEGTALDLSAVVGGVAAGAVLTVTYYTTVPSALTLDQDELRVVAAGATAANVSDGTAAVLAKLPAALVAGRIDASVGAMAAGVVTAAAIATDAIDADALAASAVTEIQSGLALVGSAMTLAADAITAGTIAAGAIGASEAPLLANLDAAVSTRATAAALTTAQTDITSILAFGAPPSAATVATQVWATATTDALYTYGAALSRLHRRQRHPFRLLANGTLQYFAVNGVTVETTRAMADVDGNAITPPAAGDPARAAIEVDV